MAEYVYGIESAWESYIYGLLAFLVLLIFRIVCNFVFWQMSKILAFLDLTMVLLLALYLAESVLADVKAMMRRGLVFSLGVLTFGILFGDLWTIFEFFLTLAFLGLELLRVG